MKTAILLAAGRGRRLGIDEPKVLTRIDGHTLLERHIAAMSHIGIDKLVVVTGFGRERLDDALASYRSRMNGSSLHIEARFNERFAHGSLVSLWCARDELLRGAIYMDADVLYPPELLGRLLQSEQPNCCLLDGRSSEQGEEMMLGARDGRVWRIARRVGDGDAGGKWDLVGESVGFFKVDAPGGAALVKVLDREVAEGRLDQEHEDGLDRAFAHVPVGFQRVDDLPWTEIDFPEDVERAQHLAAEL